MSYDHHLSCADSALRYFLSKSLIITGSERALGTLQTPLLPLTTADISYDLTLRFRESTTLIVLPLQPVANTQCCPLFTLMMTRYPTSRFILMSELGILPSNRTPKLLMEAHTKSSLLIYPLLFLSQVLSVEGFWLTPMPDSPMAAADTSAPTWQMVFVEVPSFQSFHFGSHWLQCGQSRDTAMEQTNSTQSSLSMVIKLFTTQAKFKKHQSPKVQLPAFKTFIMEQIQQSYLVVKELLLNPLRFSNFEDNILIKIYG